MSDVNIARETVLAAVAVCALLLVGVVPILAGATFGQRCAAHWEAGSPEHELCVHEMAQGLRDFPSQPLLQEPTHD